VLQVGLGHCAHSLGPQVGPCETEAKAIAGRPGDPGYVRAPAARRGIDKLLPSAFPATGWGGPAGRDEARVDRSEATNARRRTRPRLTCGFLTLLQRSLFRYEQRLPLTGFPGGELPRALGRFTPRWQKTLITRGTRIVVIGQRGDRGEFFRPGTGLPTAEQVTMLAALPTYVMAMPPEDCIRVRDCAGFPLGERRGTRYRRED